MRYATKVYGKLTQEEEFRLIEKFPTDDLVFRPSGRKITKHFVVGDLKNHFNDLVNLYDFERVFILDREFNITAELTFDVSDYKFKLNKEIYPMGEERRTCHNSANDFIKRKYAYKLGLE